MLALLLTAAIGASSQSPRSENITEPVELSAPHSIVAAWTTFDVPLTVKNDDATITVTFNANGPHLPNGRLDVLESAGSKWVWSSAQRYTAGTTLSPTATERAILLRFPESPFYYWGVISPHSTHAVVLQQRKNLSIQHGDSGTELVLYCLSEPRPRVIDARLHTFRLVPVEAAIVCSVVKTQSRCKSVTAAETEIDFRSAAAGDARVLRLMFQERDAIKVLRPSHIAIRPQIVPATIDYAYPWAAVSLPSDAAWEDLVIDRSGSAFATQRVEGWLLQRPASFFEMASESSRGISVRPWIAGSDHKALSDASALLVVFPHGGAGVSETIPMATASPGPNGQFTFAELGSGDYTLKLYSVLAKSTPLSASLGSGVVTDVTFPTGPAIRGRILRGTSSLPNAAAIIEIGLDISLRQAAEVDPIETFRSTTADENGNFILTVSISGHYRLRARWGSASAERTVAVGKTMTDVDLGDIELSSGASLRGFLPSCGGGEAILIPVPNLSKPVNLGTLTRRSHIDSVGRFIAEGLSGGQWSVLAQCSGKIVDLTPALVSMPETGDAVIDFTAAHP